MNTKAKWTLCTLAFAIVGFQLDPHSPVGERIWGTPPEEPGAAGPTPGQMGLLLGVAGVQTLAFGLGLAVLVLGWGSARRSGGLATGALVAVAWGLASWVPHTAAHMTSGANLGGLIVIEYAFHLTLVAGAMLLARFVVDALRARAGARQGPPSSRPHPTIAPRPAPAAAPRRL